MAPEVASFAVVDCTATKDSITIEFSHSVAEKGATGFLGGKAHLKSALNAKNYTIFTRDSVDFKEAKSMSAARNEGVQIRPEVDSTGKVITFKFRSSDPAQPEFQAGASVGVAIHDVQSLEGEDLPSITSYANVPGHTASPPPSGPLTSFVEDATAAAPSAADIEPAPAAAQPDVQLTKPPATAAGMSGKGIEPAAPAATQPDAQPPKPPAPGEQIAEQSFAFNFDVLDLPADSKAMIKIYDLDQPDAPLHTISVTSGMPHTVRVTKRKKHRIELWVNDRLRGAKEEVPE
jgi:hypothetical protein